MVAWLDPEFRDRVGGDDRGQHCRLCNHHLHLGHQPLDPDLAHDPAEAVAGTHLMRGSRAAAEPFDLLCGHDPAVTRISPGLDPTLTIPAAQRVEADPERPGRLTRAIELSRHRTPS